MASTAAALKGALVVAVCMVLLPSSMGQFNCSMCTPSCYENCQATANSAYSKCTNVGPDVYAACYKGCTTKCKGINSDKAFASCETGSCSSDSCLKKPCEHSCCQDCSAAAGQAAYQCTSAAGRVMQFCPPSCYSACAQYCTSPPPPAPAAPAPAPPAPAPAPAPTPCA
ncbi:unnamed protein product [Urochloa decumbens]|uniref:Uncharacterized protein n=1 Tax=Urochloa decumbens TaxID=240449 RepID=A0ABC8VK79_9POAL